jgi:MOSC domain-containing protein YiiM
VPGSLVSSAKDHVRFDLQGIPGDRHYGFTFPSNERYSMYPRNTEIRNSRQISLLSREELNEIAAALGIPQIFPEWLGANLLLSGIPSLTFIPPSSRLVFEGGVVLVMHGENNPCTHPGDVIQAQFPAKSHLASAFVKAAYHHRGLVGWVEHPGVIRTGEKVRAEIMEQVLYNQFLTA